MVYIGETTWIILLFSTVQIVKSTPTTGDSSMTWTYSLKEEDPNEPYRMDFNGIDAMFIGENNHSLALLKWIQTDVLHPTSMNLTMRMHTFDGHVYEKTCDIIPTSREKTDWTYPVAMTFLRHDRILLTWSERRNKREKNIHSKRNEKTSCAKFQVISMDSCKTSEFYDVKLEFTFLLKILLRNVKIVKFSNTFEIITMYYPECNNNYDICKMVFNYDGIPLTNVPEPVVTGDVAKYKPSWVYAISYTGGEGYVFEAPYYYDRYSYSPIQGWQAIDPDFKGLIFSPFFYSNSSGFATFCWRRDICHGDDSELRCKWLDGTNNHTVIAKLNNFNFFQTLNNLNGNVVLLRSVWKGDNNGHYLVADEIQADGMCKRTMLIQVDGSIFNAQLSLVDRNKYCFSYITRSRSDNEEERNKYMFTTQCIQTSGEQLGEPFDC